MGKKCLNIFILSFSLILISCDGGPTSNIGPTITPIDTTAALKINGNIYYDTNCGGCHSLGLYDPDSAFGASDLKLLVSLDAIKSDMSDTVTANYGGLHELMGRFNSVSSVRVKELKEFISKTN